jgi:hypothetical protein
MTPPVATPVATAATSQFFHSFGPTLVPSIILVGAAFTKTEEPIKHNAIVADFILNSVFRKGNATSLAPVKNTQISM